MYEFRAIDGNNAKRLPIRSGPTGIVIYIHSLIEYFHVEVSTPFQANIVTSFLDKSILYGSAAEVSNLIRAHVNGTLRTNQYGNLPVQPNCNSRDFKCWLPGNVTHNYWRIY